MTTPLLLGILGHRTRFAALVLAVAICSPIRAHATSTFTALHAFPMPPSEPHGHLVQASDGVLYGTTSHGGPNDQGEIYSLSPDGSGGWVHTTLLSFGTPESTLAGSNPYGGLIEGFDGLLYGTTVGQALVWPSGCGAVFGVTKGGQLNRLWRFACGDDGSKPYGTLAQAPNGDLYGTTREGGSHGLGVIFKVSAGSKTVLYSFGGPDGASPQAGLVRASDGNFYGTTVEGGSAGVGTVFRITPSGALTTLHSFQASEGVHPYAGLAEGTDGALYGTTSGVSASIFKITTQGTLTFLHSLPQSDDRVALYGPLVQGGDLAFYGTAPNAGNGAGTVYRVTSAGDFSVVHAFTGTDGARPDSGLSLGMGGRLCGTTPAREGHYLGTVFCVDGGVTTSAYSFGPLPDGSIPTAGLVPTPDGDLYGVTYQGGTFASGTIFKVSGAGTTTILHSLGGIEGANPRTLLQGADGDFYGTTENSGSWAGGSVFRVTPDGTLTVLHSFQGPDGSSASGLVQSADGDLYGTTRYGGASNVGVLFRITTGGDLTILHQFSGADGAYPSSCLIQADDGNLYGLTAGGGVWSLGTVFRLTLAGDLTTLHSFSGPDGAYDGCIAQAASGEFFGWTAYGGAEFKSASDSGFGTLFKITPTGLLTPLYSFGSQTTGILPTGLVPDNAGGFIGALGMGGPPNYGGSGALLRVTPGGAVSTLFLFPPDQASHPNAPVLALDGDLYGTTANGGSLSGGVVYRLTSPSPVPGLEWPHPTDIVYGTPLTGAQLAATAAVPGVFAYSPPAGTVLPAGPQILNVTFSPDDTATYSPTTLSVLIRVLPAPLTIRADDKTKRFRASVPKLTASYSGFVNGDTPASLAGAPVLTTLARASSPPGLYPITLSGAASPNYEIAMVDGTLTIRTPGPPPGPGRFEFSAPTYGVVERSAFASISVRRLDGVGAGATVDYLATDGTAVGGTGPGYDYAPTSGTLTFGANQTLLTFRVPINSDSVHEAKETILLRLSNAQPVAEGAGLGAQSTAVLSIGDDDVGGRIQFAPTSYATDASATATAVRLSVRRTGGQASGVAVHYTTLNGTATAGMDYQKVEGDLTFASSGPGARMQTITIPVHENRSNAKSFTVALGSPTGGAVVGAPVATVTILGTQSSLGFAAVQYSARTTQSSASIVVRRTAPLLGTVTVHYATTPGTALNDGIDYTDVSGDLTFPPGISSRAFTVPITPDPLLDAAKTVGLALSDPSGMGALDSDLSSSTLTILNPNITPTVEFGEASLSVTDASGRLRVAVRRSGDLTGALTVAYEAIDGTAKNGIDFSLTPGTLTFPERRTIQYIDVVTHDDGAIFGTKQFTLRLSSPTWTGGTAAVGARGTTTVNVLDSGSRVQFASAAYSVIERSATVLVGVRRLGALGGPATVAYDAVGGSAARDVGGGGDYLLTPGTLSFGPGQSLAKIPVVLKGDRIADGNKTIILELSSPSSVGLGTPSSSTLTIRNPYWAGTVQFSSSDFSEAETGGAALVTITRTGASEQATVHFQTLDADPGTSALSGIDYSAASGTVTFSAGQKVQTIPITVHDNGAPDQGAVSVGIALDSPGGGLEMGARTTTTLWIVRE